MVSVTSTRVVALAVILAAQPAAAMSSTLRDVAILRQAADGHSRGLEAALPTLRDPPSRAVARMILAASRLRDDRVRTLLSRYLALDDRDPQRAALAWSVAANSAFAAGGYVRAARDAKRLLGRLANVPHAVDQVTDAQNLAGTAAALAPLPVQRLLAKAPRPSMTVRDRAGLLRTDARIDGKVMSVVLDTGANISTICRSAAQRLGVHVSTDEARVGSGTRDAIKVRVGHADTVEVAGATFANVAFLVLDDDQLALPIPGYTLDIILGFPVFRAMQRVRFSAEGIRPFAPPATGTRVVPVRFDGSNLFASTRVNGRIADLQLDSGAPATSLTSAFAARNIDLLRNVERRTGHRASAGGAIELTEALLPGPRIEIGACTVRLPEVPVAVRAPAPQRQDGILGQDLMARFSAHVIDFRQATLELEGPPC